MALSIINFSGCGNKDNSNSAENDKLGYQLEKPSKNEEVAVVNTNLGSFKIRFFAEEAPKAVENFKTHSKNGYYNGISFHRVIKDFMIQGGDPEGNGTGGQSIWGTDFNDEFSENLINITGSISMANRGPNTNGSQFFINNKSPLGQEEWNNYEKMFNMYKKNPAEFTGRYGTTLNMDKVTNKYKDLYNKYGGNLHLDGYYSTANRGHTVFGQVFEGMDVVNKISDVEVDANDVPKNKVEIQNISIENME